MRGAEQSLVVPESYSVKVFGESIIGPIEGVEIDQCLGIVPKIHMFRLDLVTNGQKNPVRGIELEVGSVHPEDVRQASTRRSSLQLCPVLFERSDLRLDRYTLVAPRV